MREDLKISQKDMESAEIFTKALSDCYSRYGRDCFSDFVAQAIICLDCPLAKFKAEIYLQARPFWDGYHKLSTYYVKNSKDRYSALCHLLLGLGAVYSANQKVVPPVSEELIMEINQKIQNDPLSAMREIISDLKGLNPEWYKGLYRAFKHELLLPEQLWINSILLLRVFIEAIHKSSNENEGLFNEISTFLRQEREKKKGP